MNGIESLVKRERSITAAALIALTLLACVYIWRGAGMGMSAQAMTKLALFPHLLADPMPPMAPSGWLTVTGMWWIMMIAMMTPSAAPLILLYGRVMRHANALSQTPSAYAQTAFLAGGYLLAWLSFSIMATGIQYFLQRAALISPMMLWSQSAALSAIVLFCAGLYQLSPIKHACLKQCRGPVQFLTTHMRQGNAGALIMGIEHGAWCIGCCWLLMLLLFVGGVMNLVWIALLAGLVMIEKLAPRGPAASRIAGTVLIAWSVATLIV